jgi:hypothetical protein
MFSASNPSAVWIGKADNVVGDMASGRKPGRGIPNVKVAILDTGVSPHHPFTKKVQDPRDRRYKDRYKDFVPKTGEQPDDNNTSHGTRALDLVLRMYEDADVYVARVFETDLSKPERDAYRMGEVRRPLVSHAFQCLTARRANFPRRSDGRYGAESTSSPSLRGSRNPIGFCAKLSRRRMRQAFSSSRPPPTGAT